MKQMKEQKQGNERTTARTTITKVKRIRNRKKLMKWKSFMKN